MNCPRCNAEKEHCRVEHEGREEGVLVWTVYYCEACAFTWRDSEPPESIDYEKRDAWFRVDPGQVEKYPQNIPPSKNKK